jgi:hypothetical protein
LLAAAAACQRPIGRLLTVSLLIQANAAALRVEMMEAFQMLGSESVAQAVDGILAIVKARMAASLE